MFAALKDFGTLRPCTDLKQIESFGMVPCLAICGDAAVEAGIEGVAPPEESQLLRNGRKCNLLQAVGLKAQTVGGGSHGCCQRRQGHPAQNT